LKMVRDFLAQKRIAMVGVSRDNRTYSAKLFDELCCREYDMVPVNPRTDKVQGRECYARVQDIQPPVQAALLMTSATLTEDIVRDCAEAHIRHIWMYRASGTGAVNQRAVELCDDWGIQVVAGECPLMFLPGTDAIHRMHGFVRKITGRYPKQAA